mmetsp:Transcript_6374/g.15374  ORF Transcript_6374/g.15374 Transcript_6374/m.15374 type:complete len:217 (+) Transcript_6374:211-861(+)
MLCMQTIALHPGGPPPPEQIQGTAGMTALVPGTGVAGPQKRLPILCRCATKSSVPYRGAAHTHTHTHTHIWPEQNALCLIWIKNDVIKLQIFSLVASGRCHANSEVCLNQVSAVEHGKLEGVEVAQPACEVGLPVALQRLQPLVEARPHLFATHVGKIGPEVDFGQVGLVLFRIPVEEDLRHDLRAVLLQRVVEGLLLPIVTLVDNEAGSWLRTVN